MDAVIIELLCQHAALSLVIYVTAAFGGIEVCVLLLVVVAVALLLVLLCIYCGQIKSS